MSETMKFFAIIFGILMMIIVCVSAMLLNVWLGILASILMAIGLIIYFERIEEKQYNAEENEKIF